MEKNKILPTVSIILTTYNSEKYIEKMLESIQEQKCKDFELIIVDDGSKDHTPTICQMLTEGYVFQKKLIFLKQNQGVSNARNIGMKNATGLFLFFIDSDDYLEKNCISTFIESGYNKRGKDSLIIMPYRYVNEHDVQIKEVSTYDSLENSEQVLKDIVINKQVKSVLWNKFFSKKVIQNNNLSFDPNLTIGEDFLFVVQYVKNSRDCLLVSSTPVYNYRVHKDSVITTQRTSKCLSVHSASEWHAITLVELLLNEQYNEEILCRKVMIANKLLKKNTTQATYELSKELKIYLKKNLYKILILTKITVKQKLLSIYNTFRMTD